MSEKLLTRIRKLNWTLSESASGYVSFDELCDIIGEMLDSNVYIMNKRGKVLAAKYNPGEESPLVVETEGKYMLPSKYNDKFLQITETKENLIYDSIKEFYGEDYKMASKYHVIVPIIFGGERVATLLLARPDRAFDDEDVAICEYGATVIGLEVTKGIALEEEADNREQNAVSMALETLSYSELDAVTKIFAELDGNEGLLVASKVADKSGITRSVIVNALRKLESAGVIESRSLGMKGTRIKITNEFLRGEIEKINI
ncbi:GTP-sensing pleiotropic transcriptional regulator CodY [Aminicella lysinilytica]|uniref:Global transcriptional regulator CodY n=1 Tax=Aminicella lysinilytica TaxID=433323 RepID=A0A4R6Q6R0_9FIRM|nr:GTP-sensing pleiotropic transcriptional regulator CodY [Aminicella lysinilytica]TDP57486.1 transcriptional pleiotropic repressor [Aminicella lysinilytica]